MIYDYSVSLLPIDFPSFEPNRVPLPDLEKRHVKLWPVREEVRLLLSLWTRSSFLSVTKFPPSLKLCFSANFRICWRCKDWCFKGAQGTAIAVEQRWPISCVTCLHVKSDWFNRSWYCKMSYSFFCKYQDTFTMSEPISLSWNWIWREEFKTYFWKFITNPRFCNMKINVPPWQRFPLKSFLPLRCRPDKWSTERWNVSLMQFEFSLVL